MSRSESRIPDLDIDVLRGSAVAGGLGRISDAIRDGFDESRLQNLLNSVEKAVHGSKLSRIGRSTVEVSESSWLYRWLTAEPEPEVVVIDLRETLTVGSLIELVDRAVSFLVPAWVRSRVHATVSETYAYVRDETVRSISLVVLASVLVNTSVSLVLGDLTNTGFVLRFGVGSLSVLGVRSHVSWDEIAESKPAKLLIAVLEPPEPPRDSQYERQVSADDREEP
ncbi:hypothetical protein ACEU6E_05345 [Halorutilales archaeon Cl-col2-1]